MNRGIHFFIIDFFYVKIQTMRLIAKTIEKVVIGITSKEVKDMGFDYHWDKIRGVYSDEKYLVESIGASPDDNQLIIIELTLNSLGL